MLRVTKSQRKSFALVCFLVIALALIIILLLQRVFSTSTIESDRLPLWIDSSALSLGEVWRQQNLLVNVPVKNRSNKQVNVSQIKASCNCTSIVPTSFTIRPNETKNLQIHLDLLARSLKPESPSRSELSIFLVCLSEDGHKVGDWELTGAVKAPFSCDTSRIDFGKVVPNIAATKQLRVTPHYPLADIIVQCSDGTFSASVKPVGPTDNEYTVIVTHTGRGDTGAFIKQLRLAAKLKSSGEKLPSLPVSVEGYLLQEVVAQPSEVVFGACKVGDTRIRQIKLYSPNGTSFKVVEQITNGDGLSAISLPKQEQGHYVLEVSQKILKEGSVKNTCRLNVLTGGDKIESVEVPVLYFGHES